MNRSPSDQEPSTGQGGTNPSSTREALLDAAEVLLADGGIQGTSLRAITTQAGANLAAVNYHFGSKEGLVRAVFERRIGPVNAQRLDLLDAIEASGQSSDLDALLRAFIAPVLSMGAQSSPADFKRLLGRIFTEPGEEMGALLTTQFEDVALRFGAAFSKALPDLPRDVLIWRFHCMLGSMVHMALNGALVVAHSNGICDPSRGDEVIQRMVEFVAAGFRAPAAELAPRRKTSRSKTSRRRKGSDSEVLVAPDPGSAVPGPIPGPIPGPVSGPSPAEGEPSRSSEGIFAWEDGF